MPIEKDTIENLQEYFMKKMHNHKKKETLMINFSVLIIWFLYTCTMIFFDINFNSKFLLIILSILFGINFSYFLFKYRLSKGLYGSSSSEINELIRLIEKSKWIR